MEIYVLCDQMCQSKQYTSPYTLCIGHHLTSSMRFTVTLVLLVPNWNFGLTWYQSTESHEVTSNVKMCVAIKCTTNSSLLSSTTHSDQQLADTSLICFNYLQMLYIWNRFINAIISIFSRKLQARVKLWQCCLWFGHGFLPGLLAW